MSRLFKNILLAAITILVVASCRKDIPDSDTSKNLGPEASTYDSKIVIDYNNLYLELDRMAANFRPCPTARTFGYLNLACYESVVHGMPGYRSLAPSFGLDLPKPFPGNEYHWPTAFNAAQGYLLKRFFPFVNENQKNDIVALEKRYEDLYQDQVSTEVFERSKLFGITIATKIWEWSTTDKVGHDAYLDPFRGYNWVNNFKKDGDWRPTNVGVQNGIFSYFGGARTFAVKEDMKVCRPPLPMSDDPTSEIYAQALEVVNAQKNPNAGWIGVFWSDDLHELTFSPPVRFVAIANQVYQLEKANFEKAVVTNAKLGISTNDVAVCVWNSKYHYNIERPATYINRVIDPNFKTILDNPLNGVKSITPPFPAYPSGHSTFGAAAAEVLSEEFGFAYSMTDRCHETRTNFDGRPRSFNSFHEMALENALSRIYLGVHFRMDSEEGVRYGQEIGRRVNRLPWKG